MMQKVILAVIVLALFGVGAYFFFGGSHKIKNYPSSGTTVVAFGDSLIEGVGSTKQGGFVPTLSEQVMVPIVNMGKSGDTTADGLARIDEVLAQDPKVVLLLLGGNDYLRHIPQAETEANLKKIIEQIQEKGAVVLLLGVRGGVLSDHFSEMYQSLADEYGTAYVPDVLEGLLGKEEFMSDSVHPNDAGYAHIAERIAPILAPLIR